MLTITTKPLRWWHIEQLIDIERELFGAEAWTAGMFWAELARGNHYIAVLDGSAVLGYAGMVVADDEAWINNVAVRADAQRRGIGNALVRDLLDEAQRRGVARIALEVAVDNAPAQRLYDAFEFEGIAVRRGYYQPSNTDALVMARDLHERQVK